MNTPAKLHDEKTVAVCVSFHLKPNSLPRLKRELELHSQPILRRAKGFRGQTLLISPDEDEAISISLWKPGERTIAYTELCLKAFSMLETLMEGSQKIKECDVPVGRWDDSPLQIVVRMVGKSDDLLIFQVSRPFFQSLLASGLA